MGYIFRTCSFGVLNCSPFTTCEHVSNACITHGAFRVLFLQQSLGVEQTKEQLRVQFAEKAAAFKSHCDARSQQITALEGDLEARIIMIQKLHEQYCGELFMLEELQLLSNTCEEWGIINNSHTPETILSLRAVWDVLGKVCECVFVGCAASCCCENSMRKLAQRCHKLVVLAMWVANLLG